MKTLEVINNRSSILKFESELKKMPGIMSGDSQEYKLLCPLKHTFADGVYIRELFMPKGMLFVTKIHKFKHPYFLLKGDCAVLTEDGLKRIKAPLHGITLPGTKRVIYTYEDTVWVTVHAAKEGDISKIENELTAKTYADVPNMAIDVEAEDAKIIDFIEQIKETNNDNPKP